MTLSAKIKQVAQCSKIINADQEDAKYLIHLKQVAKFVVGLGERCASTDIEEGMRVGYVILRTCSGRGCGFWFSFRPLPCFAERVLYHVIAFDHYFF